MMKRDSKTFQFFDRYFELIIGIMLFVMMLFMSIWMCFNPDNKNKLMVCDYCNKVIETGVDDYLVTPKGEHYHADCYIHVLKEEKR